MNPTPARNPQYPPAARARRECATGSGVQGRELRRAGGIRECDDRGGTQPEQQARTGSFGHGREDDEDTRADHGAEPDQHRVDETEAAQQLGRHGTAVATSMIASVKAGAVAAVM